MDAVEREEIFNAVIEMKELVDGVLPLESSILRDQILSMLVVSLIQAKLMAKFAPQTVAEARFDLDQLTQQLSNVFLSSKLLEIEKIAAILTQVAAEKGEEWTWLTYQGFLGKIRNV